MRKWTAILLSVCMLLALLVGCGSTGSSEPSAVAPSESEVASVQEKPAEDETPEAAESEAEAPAEESAAEPETEPEETLEADPAETLAFFPVEDGGSFTWFFNYVDGLTPDESTFFQEMERRTGVTVEWTCPPRQTAGENFNLMIASGDWTDLITGFGSNYTTGLGGGLTDGIILELNDVIADYMPAYATALVSNPDYTVDTKLDDGTIAAIYGLQKEGYPASIGTVIRKDWLDDLGMDLPRTYDQYHDALTAFKNEKGADSPLVLDGGMGYGTSNNNFFFSGNGVCGTLDSSRGLTPYYQVDGEVHYGALEDGFRETLEMLSQWYEEGLIYKDFVNGDLMSGQALAGSGEAGMYTAFLTIVSFQDANTGGQAWPAYDPVHEEGDEIHFGLAHDLVEGASVGSCISASCEDVELVARWVDYIYTEEGQLLANYGVEGEGFEYVDGKPQLTDLVMNNPDYTSNVALNRYALNFGIGLMDWERTTLSYTDAQKAALEVWTAGDTAYNYPTNVTMTAEENENFNRIYSDISTHVSEGVLSFITGSKALNDQTWTEFTDGIKAMNIDECTAIKQTALDRYLSR